MSWKKDSGQRESGLGEVVGGCRMIRSHIICLPMEPVQGWVLQGATDLPLQKSCPVVV